MDKQSQEHGHNVSHVMYMVVGLLVVGALTLSACGEAVKSVAKANEPAQAAGIVMPANLAQAAGKEMMSVKPEQATGKEMMSVNPEQVACPPAGTPGKDVGRDFFVQVVGRLNDVPASDFAVDALVDWEPWEGTAAIWNPLATTWGYWWATACDANSAHVQHYQDQEMGVQATADTLNQGYYDAIRKMLRREAFDREGLRAALGTWGTCSGQSCDSLLNTWQALWDGG
jgi:hypothetical protein